MGKTISGVMLLALSGCAFAQGAPFCVFWSGTAQCFYHDVASCRQAAASLQGMCAPNQQQQQMQANPVRVQPVQPYQPTYNIYEGMMQGLEAGRRGREDAMARQRHEAEMRLLEAQIEATRQQQASQSNVWADLAAAAEAEAAKQRGDNFRCDRDGTTYYTSQPVAGCVYLGPSP